MHLASRTSAKLSACLAAITAYGNCYWQSSVQSNPKHYVGAGSEPVSRMELLAMGDTCDISECERYDGWEGRPTPTSPSSRQEHPTMRVRMQSIYFFNILHDGRANLTTSMKSLHLSSMFHEIRDRKQAGYEWRRSLGSKRQSQGYARFLLHAVSKQCCSDWHNFALVSFVWWLPSNSPILGGKDHNLTHLIWSFTPTSAQSAAAVGALVYKVGPRRSRTISVNIGSFSFTRVGLSCKIATSSGFLTKKSLSWSSWSFWVAWLRQCWHRG